MNCGGQFTVSLTACWECRDTAEAFTEYATLIARHFDGRVKYYVTPECLYFGPRFLYERYKLPVIITENGQSCNDRIFLDGAVHDPDRIDFLTRYLRQLRKAAEEGVPIKGYFHWSLTDNFEWHSGYDEPFGLVYVDYETQERIIKDSGYWYRDVIKNNGNI